MNKRIPLGIVIALITVCIITSCVATVFVLLSYYDELLVKLPERAAQYENLADVDELVRNNYYGKIDRDKIDNSLTSGYLSGLDDRYSFYISPDDKEAYESYIDGKLTGIGITTYFDNETGALRVSYVDANSPAMINGFTTDCFIVSVNGKNVDESNAEEMISLISDTKDKKLKIGYLESASQSMVKEISIESGYRIKSCYSNSDGTVGYIKITSFYSDTYDTFTSALDSLKDKGISAIILDLRNCDGNNFDVAAKIIDRLVPVGSEGTGAIFTAKNSSGEVIKQVASDAVSENLSLAVLINDRTECAAELIACDLRDFGKAVIVGENSAGHGTMQEIFNLDNGAIVSMTVAEVYPYISSSFDGVGIKPDFEVLTGEAFKNKLTFTDDFTGDEQYNKAYSYLTGKNN